MKKILSLSVAAIAISACVTAFGADVQPPPQYGMTNSSNATRGKFCRLAYDVLHIRMGTELTDKTGLFTDTDDPYINTLASCGIIDGRGNGIFDPDGLITREESARILCSMMDFMGIEDLYAVDEDFKDFDTVSDWAKEYVRKVGRNEIMEGGGDGYDFNAIPEHINVPSDTFHLYNSEFGPHQYYTEWQTKATLYRLSNRLPEKMDGETVTDLGGGVKLCDNWKYTYAEKDGRVTFCMPHDEKYLLADRGEGQPVLAHNECLYDLRTGKRIKKFYHDIFELTNVYAATKTYFDMSFTGTPDLLYSYYYDFDGNILREYMDSWHTATIEYLTDTDGGKHYKFRNEDGNYITGVYSAKPLVSGKYSIKDNIEGSNCFVCILGSEEDPTYQIYDFDANLLYEGKNEAAALGENCYAVKNDGGYTVYSSVTNEELFTAKGDGIYRRKPSYFSTYTEGERLNSYNIYSYDGSLIEENASSHDEYTTYYDDSYLIIRYPDKIRLFNMDDLTLAKEFEGGGYFTDKPYRDDLYAEQYFLHRLPDKTLEVCDKDFNPIVNVGRRYADSYLLDNVLHVYPNEQYDDDGQDRWALYSLKDMSLKFEFVHEQINRGNNYTENYVLTDCDGERRLHYLGDADNYITVEQKTYKYSGNDTEYDIRLREHNGIAAIVYYMKDWSGNSDIIDFYDSSLNKIYTGDYAIDWSRRYVAKNYRGKVGAALYYYDGGETGITSDDNYLDICTVNGKERIIVEKRAFGDRCDVIYDGDTLEEITRTDYKFIGSDGSRMRFVKDLGGDKRQYMYMDENGN